MKNVVGIWKDKLKGKDIFETLENYSILFVCVGAALLSFGIGLTSINQKGLSTIFAMLGALISFLSTIALIIVWISKEFFGE